MATKERKIIELEKRIKELDKGLVELERLVLEQQKSMIEEFQQEPLSIEELKEVGEGIQQIILITNKRRIKLNV